ncbi:mitochondrial inner membrane translocase subunit, partial [Cystoisospora suis]
RTAGEGPTPRQQYRQFLEIEEAERRAAASAGNSSPSFFSRIFSSSSSSSSSLPKSGEAKEISSSTGGASVSAGEGITEFLTDKSGVSTM